MPLKFREIGNSYYASYHVPEKGCAETEQHPWIRVQSPERGDDDAAESLCATCSRLNLDFLFHQVLNEVQVSAGELTGSLTDGIRLGSLELIKQNRNCALCKLICIGMLQNKEVLTKNPFDKDQVSTITEEMGDMVCYLDNHVSAPTAKRLDSLEELARTDSVHIELRVRAQQPYEARPGLLLAQSNQDVLIHRIHTDSSNINLSILDRSVQAPLPGPGNSIPCDSVNPTQLAMWVRNCVDKDSIKRGPDATVMRPFSSFDIRLIDVKRHCLVQPSHVPPFVALSYVWGKVQALTLTQEALATFQQVGWLSPANSKIPQTIRDAITVCGLMGESFLWVDSLCIVQDTSDRFIQIQHMDAIYQQAKFTIIATAGVDANAGLPGVDAGSRQCYQHLACVQGHTLANVLPPDSVVLRTAIWSYRGWTLQEELLSPRKLYFTNYQVYYTCSHGTSREDSSIDVHQLEGNYRSVTDSVIDEEDTVNLWEYQNLVALYTNRDLTYQTDALAAFEGIGNYVCTKLFRGSKMLAGIPMCILDLGLLWIPKSPLERRLDRAQHTYPFPSWSWVGWYGVVEYLRRESETTKSRVKWVNSESHADQLPPQFTGMPSPSWVGWSDWERHINDSISSIYYTCKTEPSNRQYSHPVVPATDASLSPFDPITGYLHFIADIVKLPVTDDPTMFDGEEMFPVHSLAVRDAQGRRAGTVFVDADTHRKLNDRNQSPYTFIKLSQTTLRADRAEAAWNEETQSFSGAPGEPAINPEVDTEMEEEFFDTDYYDPTLNYCIYNVLMIEMQEDVSFRICLGVIYIHAFDNADPQESKIILG